MSGSNKGIVESIKKKISDYEYEIPMHFHCMIRQKALCWKVLA